MKKLICNLYFTFSYRISLMKKLLISYSVLIFLPMLIWVLFSYFQVSDTLVEQFLYSSDKSLQQTSIYLDKVLQDIVSSTDQIAFSSILTEIFEADTSGKSTVKIYKDYLTASKLTEGAFMDDILYSVDIYIDEKPLYVHNTSPHTPGITFISTEDKYAGQLSEMLQDYYGKILWFPRNIQNSVTKEKIPVITGIRYMKSTTDYTNMGIIAVNLQQASLNTVIDNASVLPNSISLILDEEGTLMALSDAELLNQYELSPEVILEKISKGQTSLDSNDNTMIINTSTIPSSNWSLVSVISYDEMLKTSKDTQNRLLLIMCIVSFLFYLAAYFISRLISKRIQFLDTRMREVQFDNYTPIQTTVGDDEISNLIKSYNHMLNKMNQYAQSLYQLGIAQKSSELNALQAQINPHFLYNTLDALHWIAVDHGEKEISEVATLLIRFYKLSLNRGLETISVRNAIEHIEIYIKLQNFRYETNIQLVVNATPEIYDFNILKLLLQPIVENSVVHGIIEKDDRCGTVTINAELLDDTLQFVITDDGIGMTQEQIVQLINFSQTDAADNYTSTGYGIKNVIERIKLFYGEEYGLIYKSTPGEGTSVYLKIPRKIVNFH